MIWPIVEYFLFLYKRKKYTSGLSTEWTYARFCQQKDSGVYALISYTVLLLEASQQKLGTFWENVFFQKNPSYLIGILETFGWFSMSKNDLEIKIFSIFWDKAKNLGFIFDLWLKLFSLNTPIEIQIWNGLCYSIQNTYSNS